MYSSNIIWFRHSNLHKYNLLLLRNKEVHISKVVIETNQIDRNACLHRRPTFQNRMAWGYSLDVLIFESFCACWELILLLITSKKSGVKDVNGMLTYIHAVDYREQFESFCHLDRTLWRVLWNISFLNFLKNIFVSVHFNAMAFLSEDLESSQ